ncbi:MAG: PEPxxWA-CTERM sorting domain-containing protein [Pseudomonadota bacterium]|nr:PEPxxWA-CTERM sorting domain-containing protein [Pseudomonadota bacterium]
MKFNALIAALLAVGSMSAQAASAPLLNTSNFKMFDADGIFMGGAAAPKLTGFINEAAGTWGVASTATFFSANWTASGGTLYTPGTYTVSTIDPGCGASVACGGDYTFTVGANQLGGMIDFAWGTTTGIDVLNIWNVATVGLNKTFTSTDVDLDGVVGIGMIDGPFPTMNANFNMAVVAVPEPETYAMLLAGLGLVGFAARRRKAA